MELAIVIVIAIVALFIAVKIAKLVVRIALVGVVLALLYFFAYPYVMENFVK